VADTTLSLNIRAANPAHMHQMRMITATMASPRCGFGKGLDLGASVV
jgi:hypothetical protein